MRVKASYKYFFHKSSNLPQGNVLLLALLILASGIVGGLSVAVLVIGDLKQAKTIDDGLIAYYDAEGGLEQSLYDIRKVKICDQAGECNKNSYSDCVSPINSITTNTQGVLKCQKQIGPAEKIQIPYLEKDKTVQLDLDPINNVESIQVSWGYNISNLQPLLEITYVNIDDNGDTTIYRPVNGVPNMCNGAEGICNVVSLILPGETSTHNPKTYQVRFKALGSSIIDLILTPNILGLDSYIDVKSKGERAKTATILQTIIPKQTPAYGFSDYVIFSEQDIVK